AEDAEDAGEERETETKALRDDPRDRDELGSAGVLAESSPQRRRAHRRGRRGRRGRTRSEKRIARRSFRRDALGSAGVLAGIRHKRESKSESGTETETESSSPHSLLCVP